MKFEVIWIIIEASTIRRSSKLEELKVGLVDFGEIELWFILGFVV